MPKYSLPFQFIVSLSPLAENLPRTQRAGAVFGQFLWTCLPKRRALAQEAVRVQLDKDPGQARRIAYHSFLHTGRSFAEVTASRNVDHRFMASRVTIADPTNFHALTASSRPIVATTGHLGAWELMAGILRWAFQDRRAQIIVKSLKNEAFQSGLALLRKVGPVEIVHSKNAASQVLPALRQHNGISAFLVDHNTRRSKALFLPFLSAPASVNFGPALIALRAKALVWPIFLLRNGPGQFILRSSPALDTTTLQGTLQDKLKTVVSFYTLSVEHMVRSYPEQWFWMHKRWKSRPKGEKIVDPRLHKIGRENLFGN
ncbi:MAG: lysophospholipid acyltransferase family protein [Desulfovermiculus sp.]